MMLRGHVCNGVVVPDDPSALPEGATVQIELLTVAGALEPQRRQGGIWRGRVWLADDFDELPADVAEAFGATTP
jgi:hypothetical protein